MCIYSKSEKFLVACKMYGVFFSNWFASFQTLGNLVIQTFEMGLFIHNGDTYIIKEEFNYEIYVIR